MLRKHLLYSLLILISVGSMAQSVPTPGKLDSNYHVIRNATIHIGDGSVIEKGAICFYLGRIHKIYDYSVLKDDKIISAPGAKSMQVYEGEGKHVYPGLIAPFTYIGLNEIDAVRATRDYRETGQFNPHVRSLIAYNTDSRVTPTIRSNGIMTAQVAPRGGRISGTSSVFNLDGWNWEDAVLKQDDGIHLNWPVQYIKKGWWASPGGYEKNPNWEKQVEQIYQFFDESKSYSLSTKKTKDLRYDAMATVFSKKKKVYIQVNMAKNILAVLSFINKYDLDAVIVGGRDAYLVTREIKEAGIPIILATTHSLPSFSDADIDQPFKTPKVLKDSGILFALTFKGSWEQRNLMFVAGTAAAYGLTQEEALQTITLNAAKILGIDALVGSLVEGKLANIIISKGDVLNMSESVVTRAFIGGKEIDLGNKQKDLWMKFR